eukprot:SAG31_NODE_4913_length_2871_cov_2.230159_3_plen_121_part_00
MQRSAVRGKVKNYKDKIETVRHSVIAELHCQTRSHVAQETVALEDLQKEIDAASRSFEKAKIDFDNKIVAATAEAQRKTHAPAHLNSPKINECKRRLLFLQRGVKRGISFICFNATVHAV